MNKRFADLCYHARLSANMTVEKASELLEISPRTLNYYEAGRSIPDETVAKMVKIYNSPELGYMYLTQEMATGRLIFTAQINTRGIASRALELNVALREVNKQREVLEDICYDDIISDAEKKSFRDCIKNLTRLAAACVGIKLFRQNKKSCTDGNSTGFLKVTKIKS